MYNTSNKLNGSIELRGDKSISHRALIVGALSKGENIIRNLSRCDDVNATIDCLRKCNIKIEENDGLIKIYGGTLSSPSGSLNCQNSGSTARMLIGVLSGHGIQAKLHGDKSLSQRPMKRIIDPLCKSGAIILHNSGCLPVELKQGLQSPINYKKKTTSAQVKTALMFASLGIDSLSYISYHKNTRNHLEKILTFLGYDIDIQNKILIRKSENKVNGFKISIPGDISNASFLIGAAVIIQGSKIKIKNVPYNETRLGFVYSLIKMGARVKIHNIRNLDFENVCDISAEYTKNLKAIILEGDDIISMIDEIPIFSIVATQANGKTRIYNAKELRVKESDRISAIFHNLSKMNANIVENSDGLEIQGGRKLYNATINHFNDHRILMSFEILQLLINGSFNKQMHACVNVSFPEFYSLIDLLLS